MWRWRVIGSTSAEGGGVLVLIAAAGVAGGLPDGPASEFALRALGVGRGSLADFSLPSARTTGLRSGVLRSGVLRSVGFRSGLMPRGSVGRSAEAAAGMLSGRAVPEPIPGAGAGSVA